MPTITTTDLQHALLKAHLPQRLISRRAAQNFAGPYLAPLKGRMNIVTHAFGRAGIHKPSPLPRRAPLPPTPPTIDADGDVVMRDAPPFWAACALLRPRVVEVMPPSPLLLRRDGDVVMWDAD